MAGLFSTTGASNLNVPKSYHDRAQQLAKREGISLDQLMTLALAEMMSAMEQRGYLRVRAARGSREKYEAVLRKVKARPPLKRDEII